MIDRAHPLCVASGQVVVYRDHMGALAFEGIEIDRQCGHQRLALAGLHLGDLALMEHDAANDLNVEVPLAKGAFGTLSHRREGLGKQIIQLLAGLDASPVLVGLGPELLVGETLKIGFLSIDALDDGRQFLEDPFGGPDQNLGKAIEEVRFVPSPRPP